MITDTSARPTLRARIASLGPVPLLAVLVTVDLALVVAGLVRLVMAGPSLTDRWLLETDAGVAEYAGYLQQAALVVLLLALCWVARSLVWAAYAALFLCALADDYLRLHENKGAWLADRLAARLWFPSDGFLGLRANDLGEVLVWGLLAAVPVLAAVGLHRRSQGWNRRASLGMAALIAGYVFFGAVLDQVHVLVLDSWLGDVVGTLEDGGELLALSASVVYVVGRLGARLHDRAPDSDVPEPAAHRQRNRLTSAAHS
jgi:hypothetical protein